MPPDLLDRWLEEAFFRFWPRREAERCRDVVAVAMGKRGKSEYFVYTGSLCDDEAGYIVYDERRRTVHTLRRPGAGGAELSRLELARLAGKYASSGSPGTAVEHLAIQDWSLFDSPLPDALRGCARLVAAGRARGKGQQAQAAASSTARPPTLAGTEAVESQRSLPEPSPTREDPLSPELREMARSRPAEAARYLIEHERNQKIERAMFQALPQRERAHSVCCNHAESHRLWGDYHEESRETLHHYVCAGCGHRWDEWSDE